MTIIARRRRSFVGGKLTRFAGRAVARYVGNRAKRYLNNRSQPNESRARTAGTDNPLTTQHDYKVDYRRRRRTRRLRRRIRAGRKFTRRVVNSYVRTMQSPKQVAKLAQFTRISGENSSNYFAALLHTADGAYTGDNPQADWREWFIEGSSQNRRGWDELNLPTAGPTYPFVSERGRAIRSNSSSMELTIRNSGTNAALVSVYRVVCKRDWPFPSQTLESIYEQGFRYSGRVTEHDQPVEAGQPWGMWDSQMEPQQLTSTPFQSFLFTKLFTIYRRTKYQLSPGEEINLMLKSSRPRVVQMEKVRGKTCVGNLTHGYFVDFQGVPAYDSGEESTFALGAQLSIQKMVRYSLTMMPQKRPSTSFDTTDPDPEP